MTRSKDLEYKSNFCPDCGDERGKITADVLREIFQVEAQVIQDQQTNVPICLKFEPLL